MQIIVLLPALVCLAALFRRSLPQAFLDVYLPLFVLFPSYFFWKISSLPPISVGQSALLPLGAAIVIQLLPNWRFTTTDLWVLLFLVSSGVADYRSSGATTAIFDMFANLMDGVVPYMAGKMLIEQTGLRMLTARRIVSLMAACAVISAYEYRMANNPFTLIWSRFFPDEHFAWKTQLRWGFGRVSGPFGQSELAGIVIMFAIMLALWLRYASPWEDKFAIFPHHPFRKRNIIFGTLVFFLFMTQARGPWLGCIFAIPIAMVGKSDRVLRNGLLLLGILLPVAGTAYVLGKHYTAAAPASAEQQTAQYRAQLLDNYTPVAERGGLWGWGQNFPRAPGQESIDNEYLFLWLTQGSIGAGAFLLIAAESLIRMVRSAMRSTHRMDRFFAFSLFGAFCGILLTIGTVFLGNQPFQLFFLIAGWSQSIRASAPEPHVERSRERKGFAFQHVLA